MCLLWVGTVFIIPRRACECLPVCKNASAIETETSKSCSCRFFKFSSLILFLVDVVRNETVWLAPPLRGSRYPGYNSVITCSTLRPLTDGCFIEVWDYSNQNLFEIIFYRGSTITPVTFFTERCYCGRIRVFPDISTGKCYWAHFGTKKGPRVVIAVKMSVLYSPKMLVL